MHQETLIILGIGYVLGFLSFPLAALSVVWLAARAMRQADSDGQ